MILLPWLGLLAWTLAFRRAARGWIESIAAALVVFGLVVAVGTEVESALGLLTPAGSAAAWIAAIVSGAVLARRASRHDTASAPVAVRTAIEASVPVVLLLGLAALVALLSAPNSYDALTYHLTRVERWVQQGSVAPFATWDTRQLFMPSWSEYAMLQFRLLSGGDHFANLVEWLGLAGSCAGAWILAQALGGSRRAAVLAASLVAALPMAVAQASGTQTDVTAACWAVLACAFGYRILDQPLRRSELILCGLALGLAAATKQTAVLFGGVALIPLFAALIRRRKIRVAATLATVILVALAVTAGPQLVRNQRVFGDVRGDRAWRDDAAMAAHAPNQVIGTALRNLALHFGTPSAAVNSAVATAVAATSRAIGANPDDPRTTWDARYVPAPWTTHEESAPNPLHLLLLLGCVASMPFVRMTAVQRWFPLVLLVGFGIFCAELKWQSYNSRLQTPMFVLGLAWAATLLERLPLAARRGIIAAVTLAALPGALLNYTRPLLSLPKAMITPRPSILSVPREYTYFMYDPDLAQPYLDVAHRIAVSGCLDVAMRTWPDAWEYPVMAVVHREAGATRFRAVGVTNASARFMTGGTRPCLLWQIWPHAGTLPAGMSGWRLVVQWDLGPHQPGIALFAPES